MVGLIDKQLVGPVGKCLACGTKLAGSGTITREDAVGVYSFCSDACADKYMEDEHETIEFSSEEEEE